ncbi:MAG: DinB family protein, partial [Lapillicoccus sp.]
MTEKRPDPPDPPETPVPDEKDWTWTLERPCPDCGFDASGVDRSAIPALVRESTARLALALARLGARRRPAPATWSVLEYACHARDVCTTFTDRVERMRSQDDPQFANWDQDATALAERYWEQDPQ